MKLFLKTRKFKFKKEIKNFNKLLYQKSSLLTIQATNSGLLNKKLIETIRIAISKKIKKKQNNIHSLLKPYHPLTKKSSESRMGKGKGKVYDHIAIIKPGQVLFKVKGVQINNKKLVVLRKTKDKFPFRVSFL